MTIRTTLLVPALAWLSVSLLRAGQNPSDAVRSPLGTSPAAVAAGRVLYSRSCESCHGPGGQGDRGPALNTARLVHGNEDADLFRTIRAGVPGTQMPPFGGLDDQQVWQLAAYIRSLQGAAPAGDAPGVSAAQAPSIEGDAAAGEAIFFGRAECGACHEVNGRGGIVGPDLSGAGRLSAAALGQAIVDPNNRRPAGPGSAGGPAGPPPATVVLTTQDGRDIRGVVRNEDTFSLQMVDASGQLHFVDKTKPASMRVEARSLMPADYASRLSAREIADIVAYLRTLHGRDLRGTMALPASGGVTSERLRRSGGEPQNWLMYWGDYQGTHFSSLTAIDAANVHRLQSVWAMPIPGDAVLEGTPLVVDGVMYATGGGNPATVTAIDPRTGRQIWRWTRQQRVRNPYEINRFSRGVAVLGQRLYVGTLDAALVALDARTGLPVWETQVADTMDGYSITSPPLVVNDKVILGVAGGEFATRGFIDAYDAASGKRLWRFNTIPGPGEFGHDTWKGDSWQTGGGASWLTGTYDPELDTLYWPVGNPAAQFDRSTRGDLDNLFSDSVVALDPGTGRLKWHYQFTPNDGHDWDSVQDMILVDRVWHGRNRKLLLHADRNGHFYILDRTDGTFLSGTPFVYQNWNRGFDAKGRPLVVPGSNSSREGSFLVYPTVGGGTNFQAPSYSPTTGWLYLEYSESGQQYVSAPSEVERGRQYLGRSPTPGAPPARGPNDPAPSAGIKAIDPEDGRTMWDFKLFRGSLTNGLLATAGGVVFASTRDGNLVALAAATGAHLWHFQTGGNMAASPMSYAIDGRQFVAISAGNVLFSFALPE
jgi:PQQ-dependent dehydrogenase (methanol/ethanol family)